ncbi:YndJ family protein [Streptomyces termitum]|uniref:YndJ family protein n=1 Tax=Streptomyces termitum TaxID=67368 RepID=UPI00379A19BC
MTALSAFVVPIVTVGMVWVVPAGLALVEGPHPPGWDALRRAWPLLALPGAASLWLPRSGAATALAACYALATLALALQAPARLLLTRSARPAELAVLTALVSPAVAGLALVAERAAYPLFGFELDLLALTVPHFHFAGFAAALVAGLLCRAPGGGPPAEAAALSVPAGTLLVLAGYFVDDWAELAGAVVLTAGMAAVAVLTLRERRGPAAGPATRLLLAVSALVLLVTMALALWWALGEATGLPHPTLTWMAATHGVGNALGFAVCALLAHRRLRGPAPTDRPSLGRPSPRTELPA